MKRLPIIFLLILLAACGSKPRHTASYAGTPDDKINDLVIYAVSLADTPYRFGGASPDSGFDCSGFVGHVFRHVRGIELPRTSHEISKVGIALRVDQLRPGDLVFYNTQQRSFSHIGIFIGEAKFVHAPKSGSRIRVESMNGKYWLSRYNGARRIKPR